MNAATLTLGTKAYWIVGAMLVTLITARSLGPAERGMIVGATSWVALFVTFGHFSLAHVLIHIVGRRGQSSLSVVAGSVMAMVAVTTLAGWGAAAALYLWTGGAIFEQLPLPVLIIAFAGLPLLLWMESGNSLLIVVGDLTRLNVAQAAGTTTAIALVVLAVVVLNQGPAAALAATVASYAVVVGVALSRILLASGPLAVSRSVLSELLQGGLRLHPSAVGTFFFTHATVILLSQWRPVAEAGYFQLAMQLTAATQVVPMSVAVIASSRVARDGPDGAWPDHRRLVLQTMLYAAAAVTATYVAAPWIVVLLVGHGFAPAVPIVRILSLSVFGMSLAAVMASQWVARGYFLQPTILSLIGVAIGLAGNWLFIRPYGMYAGAWVMVASYTVHLAGNGVFAWWIDRRRASARAPREGGLYICYLGLQEPLVQTQVLPYLRELAGGGVRMALLTFEPDPGACWTPASRAEWTARLRDDGIEWHVLPYHKRPSLPATLFDIAAGAARATVIARRNRFAVLHGRSHVGAAIGAIAKPFTGAALIFDFRGFLAEEYVAAGRWKAEGGLFRLVKAAERRLCRVADGFVVLTDRGRESIFPEGAPRGQHIEVIPCCVDRSRFAGRASGERDALRSQLGVADRLVFVHAGPFGGAYRLGNTAAFLAAARQADPTVYALVLTHAAAGPIVDALIAAGFGPDDYLVTPAAPDEVPRYLSAADVGLAIVEQSFARQAASPTKFAEYLAAGLPVVTTAGIGDLDAQVDGHRVGVLLRGFDRETCLAAFHAVADLRRNPGLAERCRDLAHSTYDVHDVGGARYRRLYASVMRHATTRRLRVLALASYPVEAASSRYRVVQFTERLAERGIDVEFRPFLDAPLFASLYEPRRILLRLPRLALRTLGRVGVVVRAARADVIFVQREAMLFGPPVIEWIAARLLRRPLLLDLDDATYLASVSPVYGRLAPMLKWPGKTDRLIRWSRIVTCGNPTIASYVRSRGTEAAVVPVVVDPAAFRPADTTNGHTRIGWIGTHSTYPFFEQLIPVFERLARDVRFRLTVIGSGRRDVRVPGVEVDARPWCLAQEAEDFRSLDIGVYPLPDDEWTAGKSGLKAVQYMMSGVASVVSPVGVCETLGIPGETHLTAVGDEAWVDALRRLATDAELRTRIGRTGRAFAERHHSLDAQADTLASIIRAAAS